MRVEPKKIDLCFVERATSYAKARLDWAAELVNDARAAKRREAQECRPCFYNSKAGAAVVTTSSCGLCGCAIGSGNSCIDVVCKPCAKAHRLCKHCGGDIESRDRRKL